MCFLTLDLELLRSSIPMFIHIQVNRVEVNICVELLPGFNDRMHLTVYIGFKYLISRIYG